MKKVVKGNALDLWIIRHFKVLPTDQRFKELSREQKMLLIESYFESPLDEWAHWIYQKERQAIGMDKETAENLMRLGYTKEQVDKIIHQVRAASAYANTEE